MTNFIDTRKGLDNFHLNPAPAKRETDYSLGTTAREEELRLAILEGKAAFMSQLRASEIMERCINECPTIRMLIAGYAADAQKMSVSNVTHQEFSEGHAYRMQRITGIAGCAGHITKLEAVVDSTGEEDIIPVDVCTAEKMSEVTPATIVMPNVLEPVYS